jgi:hypothetical protein
VLVVDDNDDAREINALILPHAGYMTSQAHRLVTPRRPLIDIRPARRAKAVKSGKVADSNE